MPFAIIGQIKSLAPTVTVTGSQKLLHHTKGCNVILVQIESIIDSGIDLSQKFNPFPNKPWFLRVSSISLLKTLWEKEKLLDTSNFFFSHSVF